MSASLGHGCRRKSRLRPCPSARPGVQAERAPSRGSGCRASRPLGSPHPVRRRSWAEGAPKRAEGGALSPHVYNVGCKEPARQAWPGAARRDATTSGRRRRRRPKGRTRRSRGTRRDRARPPAALRLPNLPLRRPPCVILRSQIATSRSRTPRRSPGRHGHRSRRCFAEPARSIAWSRRPTGSRDPHRKQSACRGRHGVARPRIGAAAA